MGTFKLKEEALDFLLSGDPSVAYQTRKYLLDEPQEKLEALQRETLVSGFGRRFLSAQHSDYGFGQSDYVGKWTSTHYTLMDLRCLEIPRDTAPAKMAALKILTHKAVDGGIAISSDRKSDICVNGMFLNFASYFQLEQELLSPLLDNLLFAVLPDGGYNCRYNRGKVSHSSLHSTLSVLEGFWEYEKSGHDYRIEEVRTARQCAEEFLLIHELYKSDRTGEIIDEHFLELAFPTRWKYDLHRALYYLADSHFPYDPRMRDALLLLKGKQQRDGTFPKGRTYTGELHFPMEEGRRGRFNTLRCSRVLKNYEEYL